MRYSLHRKYASQAPNTCRAVGRMSLRYLLDAVFAVFAPQEVCLSGSKYLPCCGTDVITVFAGCCFCGIRSTGSMPLRLQIPAVLWDGCHYGICWMLFLRYSLHRKYASQAPNTCRAVGRMSLRYLLDAVFAVLYCSDLRGVYHTGFSAGLICSCFLYRDQADIGILRFDIGISFWILCFLV